MNIIDLIPPSIEENNSDSPDLESRIIQMLTDRASGGKVKRMQRLSSYLRRTSPRWGRSWRKW